MVREVAVTIEGAVDLSGRLYLPPGPGPHPAVVLMHGGGRRRLNEAPLFYAPLLARCGVAALIYDQRGTGASEGVWEAATFDDFVADAVRAVTFLQQQPLVDAKQVGVIGFSQGGQLAPVVAVEHGQVAFVVSVSAPFTPVIETRLYALEQWFRRQGVRGADLEVVLDLWRRHLSAVARGDAKALAALDDDLRAAAQDLSGMALPPPSHLITYAPIYNSLAKDYTPVLARLHTPMLALYGERDPLVPVQRSVEILRKALSENGYTPKVIVEPFANHSFVDQIFNQRIPVEETIVAWIATRLKDASPAGTEAVSTQ